MKNLDIREATLKRLLEILEEQHISINELAKRSNVPPSTVYSLYNANRGNITLTTLYALVTGAGMTLPEFFESELFGFDGSTDKH